MDLPRQWTEDDCWDQFNAYDQHELLYYLKHYPQSPRNFESMQQWLNNCKQQDRQKAYHQGDPRDGLKSAREMFGAKVSDSTPAQQGKKRKFSEKGKRGRTGPKAEEFPIMMDMGGGGPRIPQQQLTGLPPPPPPGSHAYSMDRTPSPTPQQSSPSGSYGRVDGARYDAISAGMGGMSLKAATDRRAQTPWQPPQDTSQQGARKHERPDHTSSSSSSGSRHKRRGKGTQPRRSTDPSYTSARTLARSDPGQGAYTVVHSPDQYGTAEIRSWARKQGTF
jgi:hypothetical protein